MIEGYETKGLPAALYTHWSYCSFIMPSYTFTLSSCHLPYVPPSTLAQDLVHAKGRMDEETPLHLAAAEVRIVNVDVEGERGEKEGRREDGKEKSRIGR